MNQSPTTNESSPRILASIGFSLSISLIGPDSASNAFDAEDYIWENRETWKNELKKEIDEELTAKYGQDVYSEVIRLERGSIIAQVVLVLAAGVAIYEFLSKYKDFYESVSLLKSQIAPILTKVTQSVLSSKLGKAVDSFKVRIDTSDAKVSFRNQLAQFGIVLLSGVTGLSRIGPTTYLITANLILTIIVLLVLCKTLVSLNSAAPVQVVITQSVPASIIVVPSATPTPIPVPTQTSSPSPTSTPSPSSTPTLTPTATATATPLPSSTPTPTSTFTRIVPTAAPTFESAVLLSDVSVATDRGARIILPAGTTVTILERNGCQVRMFLRDTSSRDSLQIYAWIDRTLIGESC